MLPTIYIAPGEKTSPIWCGSFLTGLQACGHREVDVRMGGPLQDGPVALWGSPQLWDLLNQAKAEGRDWYYGDNSYFGRGEYFRITKNGYQHDGTGEGSPERFQKFRLKIQPWRAKGEHIVVCPNSPAHYELWGMNHERWLDEVVSTITRYTDRKIVIRWKSRAKTWPLSEDLKGAHAVVVWSSNSAVEALIAGIPVFVLAEHAAAYRMGSHDLSQIEVPPVAPQGAERLHFCEALAANQWTLPEIRNGDAWRWLTR